MGASYVTNPVIFLIDTIISLYIAAVVIRFLFQWVRADFYNPISQFLVKITHPPLKLLRRFIPSVGKIDTSSIVLALGLQMISNFSVLMLKGVIPGVPALAIMSITQLVSLLLNIFVIAIFARAILSWFDPGNQNPASSLLHSLTEPFLGLCRKIIPDLGGMDLSPLIALVALELAKMMIIPPLNQLASLVS